MGHLQVVTGLSDQLYRNAWSVLGEFWERGAVRDVFIPVGTMIATYRAETCRCYNPPVILEANIVVFDSKY